MRQVGDQPRLYYDARSTNQHELTRDQIAFARPSETQLSGRGQGEGFRTKHCTEKQSCQFMPKEILIFLKTIQQKYKQLGQNFLCRIIPPPRPHITLLFPFCFPFVPLMRCSIKP